MCTTERIDYSMKFIIKLCIYEEHFNRIHCYCSADLQQDQGFHADPPDQAFLQAPGVQLVLFYLQDPQLLTHPVCRYTRIVKE